MRSLGHFGYKSRVNSTPIASQTSPLCPTCGKHFSDGETFGLGCPVCLLRSGLQPVGIAPDGVPESLGGYVLVRHDDGTLWELGRGAMGVTYRAQDLSLARQVALKVINADVSLRGTEARARFTREARAAAALRHPNVAMVHQFGIDEKSGHSFYAMELVEGETLEERVRSTGPLGVQTVVEIARQVTSALAASEKRRLVHRDLKPGNIMVCSEDGNDKLIAKVIDFGLAKALAEPPDGRMLTQGGFVGTPAFASPEQLNSKSVDVRSDIYSLGATLWYLLTGQTPFGDRAGVDPPIEQLNTAHVPSRLISLLRSMLAIEPAARPSVNELAEQLQIIQKGVAARKAGSIRWAIAAALITVASAAVIWGLRLGSTAPALPEKSIAVLPFTSFDDNKENGYVADGVQDEILTALTRVADLKVISRRSVEQYRNIKQSVREIGEALNVRYVLEGTVRKTAGRLHVTTQLIDTGNETETWAEKYDRDVADVYLIQSDIAQEVITRLKAELSPKEKEAIEKKPTQDLEAYDLYLRARSLMNLDEKVIGTAEDDVNKATELLEAALARDPNFTLAYCALADARLAIGELGSGWDPQWQTKAQQAINAALRISPDSAEAHLVRARYFIRGLEDEAAGEKDLALAVAGLPGRADIYSLRAVIEEVRGQWKNALRDSEHALELDPRDGDAAWNLSFLNIILRRYSQAERLSDHMIAIVPKETAGRFWRLKSNIALARGDLKAAMAALDAHPNRHDGLLLLNELVANLHIMERNYPEADEFFQSLLQPPKNPSVLPKTGQAGADLFWRGTGLERLGRIARLRDDREGGRSYFASARPLFEEWLTKDPGHNRWLGAHAPAYIAEIDAGLGRKDEAIREGRKAVESCSLQRDARIGPDMKIYLAIVYLWTGEREAALQELSEVTKVPVWPSLFAMCPGLTAGELKLNPLWDDLRADPRFQQLIVQAAKPVPL